MIDNIKAELRGISPASIRNNPHLEFVSEINESTGEVNRNKSRAKLGNLNITIKQDSYVELSGSLHHCWNIIRIGRSVNYNDFTISDIESTINHICQILQINPQNIILQNLEFGVNLNLSIEPSKYIKRAIIDFKGKIGRIDKYDSEGYSRRFDFSNYYVKVYDKSLHQNQKGNILRYEIGTKKMEHVKKSGIKTFVDLTNPEKLRILAQMLYDDFNELLICDQVVPPASLSKSKRELFSNGINPRYWENLAPDPSDYPKGSYDKKYKSDRKKYDKARSQFKSLLRKYNLNKSQLELGDQLKRKAEYLITPNYKNGGKLTSRENEKWGESYTLDKGINNPLLYSPFTSSEINIRLDIVREVIDGYYGHLYTDHEVMDNYVRDLLRQECEEKHGLEISEQEFLDYARQVEPVIYPCPF